jgi:hypothetical protein
LRTTKMRTYTWQQVSVVLITAGLVGAIWLSNRADVATLTVIIQLFLPSVLDKVGDKR